ncbi:SHOCT domain-containing protein [Halorientalis salina]|uniref:SHOCT domain-containing protein n=1 Tax=Halorientalis salina TaxID=2932266 RepID=UPI0010AD5498|nr:SHOCT domain-containing protein [Halorientalis salina]
METQHSNDRSFRIVVIVLGAIVLFPLIMMALMMPMMGMMGWSWGNGMAGGLSPMWGIGMMVGWLVVLLGIGYFLYNGVVSGFRGDGASDPALEELRLAYARGDLTDEEFEERHSRLRDEE